MALALAEVYRPICPICSVKMEVLFNTATCRNAACGGTNGDPFKRASRVVGRTPDMWHGASAKLRQFEGREVRMVLSLDEVPLSVVWHSWLTIEYCYASDFDFTTKSVKALIQERIMNQNRWHYSMVADDREEARRRLRNDKVLLLIK